MTISNTSQPLSTFVEQTLRQYFCELDNDMPQDLYQLILREVEKPMLKVVLEITNGNQCKSSEVLGISRGTLRKKMANYNML